MNFQLIKKQEAEKKKKEIEEAANVYASFVQSFQGPQVITYPPQASPPPTMMARPIATRTSSSFAPPMKPISFAPQSRSGIPGEKFGMSDKLGNSGTLSAPPGMALISKPQNHLNETITKEDKKPKTTRGAKKTKYRCFFGGDEAER